MIIETQHIEPCKTIQKIKQVEPKWTKGYDTANPAHKEQSRKKTPEKQVMATNLVEVFSPNCYYLWNLAWKIRSCHQSSLWYPIAAKGVLQYIHNYNDMKSSLLFQVLDKDYLSTKSWRQSSNLPNMNKQRKATLFFPCSLESDASLDIPSASPKEE